MLPGTDPLWSVQRSVGPLGDLQGLCQRAMSTCITEINTNVAAITAQLVCSNICWHITIGSAALLEVPAGPTSSRGHRDGAHSCE